MQNEITPGIIQEWTSGWWLWKRKINVRAQQVELPEEFGGLVALARVVISVNGKIVHEDEIPWPMPKGEGVLPYQVYLLAKLPEYAYPEWQPILKRFAFKCKGFVPPKNLRWLKVIHYTG